MQPFDLLNHAAKARMPERLTDIGSWHRHIPFAFALLDMLRPRVFVELGTHKGDSYSAFCQGITQQGLATRCYAVDTWQGDSQAGRYEDTIYAELSSYHDPRYSEFSTLLRMTFDDALEHIADGSVDLLHIDGLHTYDAVKHDFDTWLPKMSTRGVVIFHDTNVHYGDFEVWRLWAELQQRYPGFEFPHGFGLGVLAVGSEAPPEILQFIEHARSNPQEVIALFHSLGDGIELLKTEKVYKDTHERLEALGVELEHARSVVAQRDALLETYNTQKDELIRTYNAQRDALLADIARGQQQNEALQMRIGELNDAYVGSVATCNLTEERLRLISTSRLWRTRNALMRLIGKPQRIVTGEIKSIESSKKEQWQAPAIAPMIDIIIPVYRGLDETRACIESVLANELSVSAEIIVIEDASPDPELVAWLKTLDERVTLLHNDTNLGFVKTVNRGMALHPERDVVLLNADTEVASDWLGRLQRVAYSEARIGSVTPFSNSATICSYPVFCQENDLPPGLDVAAMDDLFRQVNAGQTAQIPTAIGFCMYIRRDCLDDCGLFNAELFGRGYGEENEFCMRSARRNWQHLLTGEVFVYHKGGVSFAETQSENQKAGHKALTRLYPNYDLVVREHIAADPAAHMRFAADLWRARESGRPVILLINHSRGGGTERHLLALAETLGKNAELYLLHPHLEGGAVSLGPLNGGQRARQLFEPGRDTQLLLDTLRALRVSRIHFHHTIGVHLQFVLLPEQLGIPYDVTIHDYYLACPQVTMTDEDGRYCNAPDEAGCNACLESRPAPGGVDISHWRQFGSTLLNGAERVFTPSADTRARMQRYFPDARFVFVPHEDTPTQPVRLIQPGADRPMKVLVLGALSLFKGADLLEACALEARRQRSPLEFHLLGFAYRKLASYPFSNLRVHGAYADDQVDRLLQELAPDVVWFPGSCPETYSYTLSICMRAGLPVIAPNIGAFPERMAGRPWSWQFEPNITPQPMHQLLLDVRSALQNAAPPAPSTVSLDTRTDFSYQRDYLVEPLPEQSAVEPDWQQLHHGWSGASRLQPVSNVRFPRLLRALHRTLNIPGVPLLIRRMPRGWKGHIKRVLWRS